jgi:hypothetical protein
LSSDSWLFILNAIELGILFDMLGDCLCLVDLWGSSIFLIEETKTFSGYLLTLIDIPV